MNRSLAATHSRPVTLADVAALAGVSAKTVSRVVNRDPNVSRSTRERIEAAIRDTGYRVNQAARSLAATRSYLIGAFMPNLASFYFGEIFRGATRACRQYGYHLVAEEFDYGADTVVDRYEQGLRGAGCDALILTPPLCDDEPLLAALDRDGIRYVRISPATRPLCSAALYADDRQGVRQLAEHLWKQGRRRFAMIGGPPDHASAQMREGAFTETLARLGVDPQDIALVRLEWKEPMSSVGHAAALSLLQAAGPRPDAIFAFNDEAALGAIACAREMGLTVPGDIAIAGFDDSYVAQLVAPPLTTIHQPITDLAAKAIGIIAESDPASREQLYLPTSLVIRESA